MLETLMKLYVMAMATGVTSPLPHLFGPPGCGKSTVAEELADLVGVNLHIINVSRISPLEIEGVQMPTSFDDEGEVKQQLELLPATFWSRLKKGDIVLLDEFLRGFPEVYNGLLDILTSRRIRNACAPARVHHGRLEQHRVVRQGARGPAAAPAGAGPAQQQDGQAAPGTDDRGRLGLLPEMRDSYEMQTLLDTEVLPMFDVLDNLKNGSSTPTNVQGAAACAT